MNDHELAFQIVHQVEELWMRLLAHALIDIVATISTRYSSSANHSSGNEHRRGLRRRRRTGRYFRTTIVIPSLSPSGS